MDSYEQLVEVYLTVIDHLAVIPQFPVLFNKEGQPCLLEAHAKLSWEAYPDFLAIDTRNRRAQIVEVNKSGNLSELAKRTLANRTKVEEYVRWFTSDGFQLQWRFVVRRKMEDSLKADLGASDLQPNITLLEDVFDKLRDSMP